MKIMDMLQSLENSLKIRKCFFHNKIDYFRSNTPSQVLGFDPHTSFPCLIWYEKLLHFNIEGTMNCSATFKTFLTAQKSCTHHGPMFQLIN